MKRVKAKLLVCIVAIACIATSGAAFAQKKPLRLGMTLSEISTTSGQPNGGFEGYRFTGYTIYDALINWKLDDAKSASGLTPGLATEWNVDAKDHTKWVFKLRKGVKFQRVEPLLTAQDTTASHCAACHMVIPGSGHSRAAGVRPLL